MDIVLSSGFLAFARHIGFRRVCLQQDVEVSAICGTSSGSVVGALWANGISEEEMIDLHFQNLWMLWISIGRFGRDSFIYIHSKNDCVLCCQKE